MLRTGFEDRTIADGTLSFARSEEWRGLRLPAGYVFLGDDERGPVVRMVTSPPGIALDSEDGKSAPPHGHASDNLRIALRGSLKMGAHVYGPGQFRLQQGWKAYGSDTIAGGADGGWEILIWADRRGMRMRPTRGKPDDPIPYLDVEKDVAAWMGYRSDWFGDDPNMLPAPSRLASTLGVPEGGGLTGSFYDTDEWVDVGDGSRVVVSLMGDDDCGPVVVAVATDPAHTASGELSIGTETFRVAVGGSGTIGTRTYAMGDMRVDEAEAVLPAVVSGAEGLHEIVVIADRRAVGSIVADEGWPARLADILATLSTIDQRGGAR
jgi:hypothetical protein